VKSLGPAVKVSATFLLASAACYWVFMLLAKGGCGGEAQPFRLYAFFRDATLLVEKSRVQIAGLNVGHVVARELNVRPPRAELVAQKRFAKISVALKRGVQLYSNAVIYKRSASLLGEFYLEIDPGTYEWVDAAGKRHVGELLSSGAELRFVVEASTAPLVVQQFGELLPIMRELLRDVQHFTRGPLQSIGDNVNQGVAENREAIKSVVDNLAVITSDVRKIAAGADRDFGAILDNVRATTGALRGIVGDGKVDQDIRQSLGTLTKAVEKLDAALGNIQALTGELQEGKGNLGRLLKDDELVTGVEEVVHDAGRFTKSFTELQTIVGLRSEYNFDAGSIKTYVTIELWPRPDKFYLIELIDDPRGRRGASTTITRSDDPTRPGLTREDRVVLSDAFRITFQFAKRIRFTAVETTFRFGIKESTGGLGLDVRLPGDQLQLWSDLYDFDANLYPRLKVVAAWEFLKRLYVVGGVDDAFNDRPRDGVGGGRDYLMGFQIRFNDEDLRQLLLFGGSAIGSATAR
jgi:phospholipid/cholesterol/gamma-HCH transport system substrate-binding protein